MALGWNTRYLHRRKVSQGLSCVLYSEVVCIQDCLGKVDSSVIYQLLEPDGTNSDEMVSGCKLDPGLRLYIKLQNSGLLFPPSWMKDKFREQVKCRESGLRVRGGLYLRARHCSITWLCPHQNFLSVLPPLSIGRR